jgi:hypothetical protein
LFADFYKKATGSEGSSLTINFNGPPDANSCSVIAYSGADSTTPIDKHSLNFSYGDATCPSTSLTTGSRNGDRLVVNFNQPDYVNSSPGVPGGYTQRWLQAGGSGISACTTVGDDQGNVPAGTAIHPASSGFATSSYCSAMQVALQLPPPTQTPTRTATPNPTKTPISSGSITATPIKSPTPTPTATPNPTKTPTPTKTPDATPTAGLTVSWYGCMYSPDGHKYQAMEFGLSGSAVLQANLYYGPTCDPGQLADQISSGNSLGPGGYLWWFIDFRDMPDTSAIWTLGTQRSG